MGKVIMATIVSVIYLSFCTTCIYSQDNNCIDNVTTSDNLILCGNRLIGDCEARLSSEVDRLKDKYKDNRGILILLDDTVHTWGTYRNVNCVLEGALAARGQVVGELPLEADKVRLRCNVKQYNNIIKTLSTY